MFHVVIMILHWFNPLIDSFIQCYTRYHEKSSSPYFTVHAKMARMATDWGVIRLRVLQSGIINYGRVLMLWTSVDIVEQLVAVKEQDRTDSATLLHLTGFDC